MLLLLPILSAHALDTARANQTGVGSPSGPDTLAADAMRSLDFLQQDGVWRLAVGVPGALAPELRAESDGLVLTLPGLTLPESLSRPLDTSHFHSTVTAIAATATRGGVEVRVQTRAPIEAGLAVAPDGFVWLTLDAVPEQRPEVDLLPQPAWAPGDDPLDTFGPPQKLPSLWL